MVEVVGIQFNGAARIYNFLPNGVKFEVGDYVIVETVRGIELGQIAFANSYKQGFHGELRSIYYLSVQKFYY